MTLGNPFLIGRREEQRLERRRAVSEAAREWQTLLTVANMPHAVVPAILGGVRHMRPSNAWGKAAAKIDAALAEPKPWTTGRQRMQPTHPTRARRRWVGRLLRRQLEGR